ncbi:MAG: hypothetical protein AAGA05_04845 [Pseudomonadota bacterium]
MTDMDRDTKDLEALFDAARRTPAEPAPDFLARLVDEAETEQRRQSHVPVTAPSSWFKDLWDQMRIGPGGWAGVAGLATASMAGIWFGFAPPSGTFDPADLLLGTDYGLTDSILMVPSLEIEEG